METPLVSLTETLLPRFRSLRTPPDIGLFLLQHGRHLNTDQARKLLPKPLAKGSFRDGFGVHGYGPDGATRRCYIQTENRAARNGFAALASEAGALLGPWAIPLGIDAETVAQDGAMAWTFALFELAWQGRLPMKADRFALGDGGFFSMMQDAARASVYAIEYLAAAGIGSPAPAPGEAKSEGAGHRPQDGTAPAHGNATGDETNRYAALARLPDAPRKAYLSFLCAEAANERRLDDREAWEWLQENGTDVAGAGELDGYDLPEFGTWARYLRRARKATGEQKYTPRTK